MKSSLPAEVSTLMAGISLEFPLGVLVGARPPFDGGDWSDPFALLDSEVEELSFFKLGFDFCKLVDDDVREIGSLKRDFFWDSCATGEPLPSGSGSL